ncbi:MAG: VPS10 domain-containing protein [Candidatus Aminicenantales bacterium]
MKAKTARILMVCLCVLATVAVPGTLPAGSQAAQPKAKAEGYAADLGALEFREIGPAIMGGRVDEFAVVESDAKIVYVGMASGGVWKTINAGTTWKPVFDNAGSSSIGAIAIAPSNPSIVWVGTGEANNRQSSSWGDGIYKSMDGGATWKNTGLAETHHIGRLAIHPANPDIVYVAAGGRLWGANADRGVYKTTDGGATWKKILYIDPDTGATDLVMDRTSPETLYAATYQRRRSAFGYNGGGPGSAIFKTTDGGATWTKLVHGLPYEGEADSQTGRIGLSLYQKNPNVVYAIVEHKKGGVFRSEDRGETWTRMSDVNPRPAYYTQICVDPNNDLRVWVLGSPVYYSEDGGKTFDSRRVGRIHVDNHAIWINPADSNHMLLGTDGGVHWSWDAGKTWEFVNTFPTGQFYEVNYDMQKPYRVSGGLQDNGSWVGPSMSLTQWGYWMPPGSSNNDWISIHGSDGYYTVIDPMDPNIIYAETPDGNPIRRDMRTTEARTIRPLEAAGDPRYRFYWNTPIVISKFDHKIIYYAAQFMFRSTDQGDSWTRISPDLTTGVEQNSLPTMGRLPDENMTSRQDGVWNYPCITVIAESPLDANVIWAGTDDGYLQVTRDLGKTWDNAALRIPGLPKGACVTRIAASNHAAGTAYVSFDAHRLDNFAPFIYATTDYGRTWKPVVRGIPPANGVVHALREHHRNPDLLFAGTETGLFVTFDRGANWEPLRLNLPTVPVHDIAIHPRDNDLILATHGRSIWILDDIMPLEKLAEAKAGALHLFDIRTAVAWRIYDTRRDHGGPGYKLFIAPNPPYGALINYKVNAVPADAKSVRISIEDGSGAVIRQMEGPANPGVNRVAWDLRYGPSPEMAAMARSGGRGRGMSGPIVEPGTYTVKIQAGSAVASKTAVVEDDPRITTPAAERAVRFDTLMRLRTLSGRAFRSSQSLSGLRTALVEAVMNWSAPGAPAVTDEMKNAAAALLKKADSLWAPLATERLWLGSSSPQINKKPAPVTQRVSRLSSSIESVTAAPTRAQMEELEKVSAMVDELEKAVTPLVQDELEELNALVNRAGLPHIVIAGR